MRSRKHHHTPQFYLRHFAEPMFGKAIRVFDRKNAAWDKAPRTPKGVGWEWDLHSWTNYDGQAVDDFEQFLTEQVDTPAAPALRKAATGHEHLTEKDRELIALFIGFAGARCRELMNTCETAYFKEMPDEKHADLAEVAALWSDAVKKPLTERDVVRGGFLDAIHSCALLLRDQILTLTWQFIRTPRQLPFVVSDWPVWRQKFGTFSIVSFPISSEIALVMSDCPDFGVPDDPIKNVIEMNKQTIDRARSFIVCHQDSFPGDENLKSW
jgi:Protein of unknown function (DUF4238)